MKRLGFVAVLLMLVIASFVYLASWGGGGYMRFKAARLRARRETYHNAHGKYPVSLADIPGAPLNGPIYYQRDSIHLKCIISGSGPESEQWSSMIRRLTVGMVGNRSNQSVELTATPSLR